MLATEDTGGEGPYGPAVASATICDRRVPQPGLTLAIDSKGVGSKTRNMGHAEERKEARDGSAVANATAATARTVITPLPPDASLEQR